MNRGFSWNTILWGPKSITLLLESELLQGAKYTIMETNKFWEITQEEKKKKIQLLRLEWRVTGVLKL